MTCYDLKLFILCLFTKVLVKSIIIFQFSKKNVLVKANKKGLRDKRMISIYFDNLMIYINIKRL